MAWMVSVTGTTAFGVSETDGMLNVAVEATWQLDEYLPPVPDHVQLDGASFKLRATVPVNVLLAVRFRLYVTELPGVTVWPSLLAVIRKLGETVGSPLGTVEAGQNVTI